MKPSSQDLKCLEKIYQTIKSGKKITTHQYETINKCETLPKYILNHIKFYYNFGKQYGGYCNRLWTFDMAASSEKCTEKPIIENALSLGEGAFGNVIDNGDGTVTKIFTIDDQNVLDHLKYHLPLVFKILHDYMTDVYDGKVVYHSLIEFQNSTASLNNINRIAYKMTKLASLKTLIKDPNLFKLDKLYNALYNISITKVRDMHENNIIHCDLKLDNLMFFDYPEQFPNINAMARYLKDNIVIIDYDGCILLNQESITNINNILAEGHEYHAITPIFAHPYLADRLLLGRPTDNIINKIEFIENFRNVNIGRQFNNILNHTEYHNMIFSKPYDKVFGSIDPNEIIKYLRFADYYALTMDFLFTKILPLKDNDPTNPKINAIIKFFIVKNLRPIAYELQLPFAKEPEQQIPVNGGKSSRKISSSVLSNKAKNKLNIKNKMHHGGMNENTIVNNLNENQYTTFRVGKSNPLVVIEKNDVTENKIKIKEEVSDLTDKELEDINRELATQPVNNQNLI